MHTVPGEHDTTDATVTEYFTRFGKASNNKGCYSFDKPGTYRYICTIHPRMTGTIIVE